MLRIVARLRRRARAMPRRSPFTSVMSGALHRDVGARCPSRCRRRACASAGASLIPSPAIATDAPRVLESLDDGDLLIGQDLGHAPRSMPSVRPTASCGGAAVAGDHDDADPVLVEPPERFRRRGS